MYLHYNNNFLVLYLFNYLAKLHNSEPLNCACFHLHLTRLLVVVSVPQANTKVSCFN